MEGSKFEIENTVRCINEKKPAVITGIYHDEWSYYYDITYRGDYTVHRVPESGLILFNT